VKPGEAVRIFTGAPMPAGADTVFMQEDCRRRYPRRRGSASCWTAALGTERCTRRRAGLDRA
jgi:molybdopterin biosynthesis enzyme